MLCDGNMYSSKVYYIAQKNEGLKRFFMHSGNNSAQNHYYD